MFRRELEPARTAPGGSKRVRKPVSCMLDRGDCPLTMTFGRCASGASSIAICNRKTPPPSQYLGSRLGQVLRPVPAHRTHRPAHTLQARKGGRIETGRREVDSSFPEDGGSREPGTLRPRDLMLATRERVQQPPLTPASIMHKRMHACIPPQSCPANLLHHLSAFHTVRTLKIVDFSCLATRPHRGTRAARVEAALLL